jgi:hypothetical protein
MRDTHQRFHDGRIAGDIGAPNGERVCTARAGPKPCRTQVHREGVVCRHQVSYTAFATGCGRRVSASVPPFHVMLPKGSGSG